MNESVKKEKIGMQALILLMMITALVVIYEVGTAINYLTIGDNFFDFSLKASDTIPYCFVLMLVLFGAFPMAYVLFKNSNISLSKAIYDKNQLLGDVGLGLLGGILGAIVALVFNIVHIHFAVQTTGEVAELSVSVLSLRVFSLVIVCGILKEIYYRGFAKHFMKEIMGEKMAFLMTNILFGILDWQNLGASFISGLIWGRMYQKRERLIVPIVAHASLNLMGILFQVISALK